MTTLASAQTLFSKGILRGGMAALAMALCFAPNSHGQVEGPDERGGLAPKLVAFINGEDPKVEVAWTEPETGRTYIIETSTDMQNWEPYLGEVTFENGNVSMQVSVAGVPKLFFRLRYLESPTDVVRDRFDANVNGTLEFPEVLHAASMAGPPILPILIEMQLQGEAQGAIELEQAFLSIPDPFMMDVLNLGLENLDQNQLWNMLDPMAHQAIMLVAPDPAQPHGMMMHLIVQRMGEMAYLDLPESPLAHQGLQDFLGSHFGTEPHADRAAIRALIRSTEPADAPPIMNLFDDLLNGIEDPVQMYLDPFGLNFVIEEEIERTRQELFDALTLEWVPPFPIPDPFGAYPGQEINYKNWPDAYKWGWMEPYNPRNPI